MKNWKFRNFEISNFSLTFSKIFKTSSDFFFEINFRHEKIIFFVQIVFPGKVWTVTIVSAHLEVLKTPNGCKDTAIWKSQLTLYRFLQIVGYPLPNFRSGLLCCSGSRCGTDSCLQEDCGSVRHPFASSTKDFRDGTEPAWRTEISM